MVLPADHESFHLEAHDAVDVDANRAAVCLDVPNAYEWHGRWQKTGVTVADIADEPWGMREVRVIDPWGNIIRVGTNR